MANSLNVVAKIFSNTLILFQQIVSKSYSHFYKKNIDVFIVKISTYVRHVS